MTHKKTGDEAADLIQIQDEAAQVADVSRVGTDDTGPHSLGRSSRKAPKMPYFNKERDSMDSYLGPFERFATCQQ